MFTGIIEETGEVLRITPQADRIELEVALKLCARGLRIGDSLAVNGCCLTVVQLARRGGRAMVRFDLLQETWDRTNLHLAAPGSRVNLERALALGARLGGHFVTGHVDGTGRITRWERAGQDHVLDIAAPVAVRPQLVPKGSITVDGISLTVAAVTRTGLRVWIIPHTWEATTLRERHVGDTVNLEGDLLGKYVEKILAARLPARRR